MPNLGGELWHADKVRMQVAYVTIVTLFLFRAGCVDFSEDGTWIRLLLPRFVSL